MTAVDGLGYAQRRLNAQTSPIRSPGKRGSSAPGAQTASAGCRGMCPAHCTSTANMEAQVVQLAQLLHTMQQQAAASEASSTAALTSLAQQLQNVVARQDQQQQQHQMVLEALAGRVQQLESAQAAGQSTSVSLQDMLVLVKDQQMELVQELDRVQQLWQQQADQTGAQIQAALQEHVAQQQQTDQQQQQEAPVRHLKQLMQQHKQDLADKVSAFQEEVQVQLQQQQADLQALRDMLQQQQQLSSSSSNPRLGLPAAPLAAAAAAAPGGKQTAQENGQQQEQLGQHYDQQQQQQCGASSVDEEGSRQCSTLDSELSFVDCKQKQSTPASAAAAAAADEADPSPALPPPAAAGTGPNNADSAGSREAPAGLEPGHQQQQQQQQRQRVCSSDSSSPTSSTEALVASRATPAQQQQQQHLVQDQASVVHQLQAELGSLARELAQLKSSQQQQQRSDRGTSQSSSPCRQGRVLEPFAAAGPLAHELQAMECRLLKALRLEAQAQQHLLEMRVSASQERTTEDLLCVRQMVSKQLKQLTGNLEVAMKTMAGQQQQQGLGGLAAAKSPPRQAGRLSPRVVRAIQPHSPKAAQSPKAVRAQSPKGYGDDTGLVYDVGPGHPAVGSSSSKQQGVCPDTSSTGSAAPVAKRRPGRMPLSPVVPRGTAAHAGSSSRRVGAVGSTGQQQQPQYSSSSVRGSSESPVPLGGVWRPAGVATAARGPLSPLSPGSRALSSSGGRVGGSASGGDGRVGSLSVGGGAVGGRGDGGGGAGGGLGVRGGGGGGADVCARDLNDCELDVVLRLLGSLKRNN